MILLYFAERVNLFEGCIGNSESSAWIRKLNRGITFLPRFGFPLVLEIEDSIYLHMLGKQAPTAELLGTIQPAVFVLVICRNQPSQEPG